MLSKNEIKDIQSLSHKKFRKELKLFVAEGPKIISELLQLVPGHFEHLYATKEWLEEGKTSNVESTEVSINELERISGFKTPNEVLAVIRQFESKEPGGGEFVIYLDTVQDPGNLGTIIRIADWFNVKHIVCSSGCADMYNPKVIQSSMASIARVNIFYDENNTWLGGQGGEVYAASLEGRSLYDQSSIESGVLVIGNESKGISEEVMKHVDQQITIPRIGKAESLNAAVATGIILSHLQSKK